MTGADTPQFLHDPACAEHETKVHAQCSYVGSSLAAYPEYTWEDGKRNQL